MVADLLLYDWALVEAVVDHLGANEFSVGRGDDRARLLNDIPFWRKLAFLKKRGIFDSAEYKTIRSFEELRNKMFHRMGASIADFDRRTKRKVVKICTDASEAAMDVLIQKGNLTIQVTASDLKRLKAKIPKSSRAPGKTSL